jgi:hypothetical protein
VGGCIWGDICARGDVREARGASNAGEEGGYCGRVSLHSTPLFKDRVGVHSTASKA